MNKKDSNLQNDRKKNLSFQQNIRKEENNIDKNIFDNILEKHIDIRVILNSWLQLKLIFILQIIMLIIYNDQQKNTGYIYKRKLIH